MKAIKKIISLVLIAATLACCLSGCGKRGSLDKYTEDTSTEKKDFYYVAIGIEKTGVIIVKLDRKNAPKTVENFISLVRSGFYDGLTFHRVKSDFMIQGGDPDGNGIGGSQNTIEGEFLANGHYNSIKHTRGVISMARSQSYNSASSQFFICNATNSTVSNLDGYYAAFGYVVEGMDVVDKITKTAQYGDSNGMIEQVSKRAVISKMMVIEYEESN